MTTSGIPQAPTEFAVPEGLAYGAAEGAIKRAGRLDVGAIIPADPSRELVAAAVFTTNRFAAAPVEVSREVLTKSSGRVGGTVVNSGCANAVTGEEGLKNARSMAEALPTGKPALVCSTGTIGVQLPMDRLMPALAQAVESAQGTTAGFLRFADAIMTTDTRRKVAASQTAAGVTVVGCAKGSGMIAPNMATLLAYVCTDAKISPDLLQSSLNRVANRTLNCLTVDGDTSTNDTLLALSSCARGEELIAGSQGLSEFEDALESVLRSLTIQLAADGEGATTVMEVIVEGAKDGAEARLAAMEVANSPLVKTAIHGRDANWGRIAMALGNSGAQFKPNNVSIQVGSLLLLDHGTPQPFDEAEALKVLNTDYLVIRCTLGSGSEKCRVWTCDFSKEYIEINGAYRT